MQFRVLTIVAVLAASAVCANAEDATPASRGALGIDPEAAELFESLRTTAQALESEQTSSYAEAPGDVQRAQEGWAMGEEEVPPTIQRGAETWVPYGLEHPVIHCSLARACAVQLEAGEVVHHIQLGDDTHWRVEQGHVGSPTDPAPVAYFSPRLPGIATNGFISTTRRLYTLGLVSPTVKELQETAEGAAHYTRVLRFYYGDSSRSQRERTLGEISETLRDRERLLQLSAVAEPATQPAETAEAAKPAARSTNYTWKARPKRLAWSPVAVWDDGERTYIQLPANYDTPVLPAVTVTVAGEVSVPNHHYDPDEKLFVVHQRIEKAALIVKHGPKRRQASWVEIEAGR